MVESGHRAASRTLRAGRVSGWFAGLGIVVIATAAGGVGVAAVLARQGGPGQWETWSDVGQTYGALSSIISSLALVAVVVTARMQFREMQHNRAEIRRQHDSLIENHLELQRTARANLGMLHLEILRMSIDDADLGAMWPPFQPGLPHAANRQYLYGNIIYQYQLTALLSGGASEEEILRAMQYLFSSERMREFWRAAAQARASLDPSSEEYMLSRKVDEICRQFDTVVATSAHSNGSGPTPLHERPNPVHAA